MGRLRSTAGKVRTIRSPKSTKPATSAPAPLPTTFSASSSLESSSNGTATSRDPTRSADPSVTVRVVRRRLVEDVKPSAGVEPKGLELPEDVMRNICRMAQAPLPVGKGHGGVGEDINMESGDFQKESKTLARKGLASGQGVLATIMRVSKACYAIAAPLLYLEIVTDNLPLLIAHTATPCKSPSAGLASKQRLLASTRYLHLECPSQLAIDSLLLSPALSSTSGASTQKPIWPNTTLKLPTLDFVRSLEEMLKAGGFHTVFPSLESLSICAYTTPSPTLLGNALEYIDETRLERIDSAWVALYATSNAPMLCEPAAKAFPFRTPDRVTFSHRKKYVVRQGVQKALGSTRIIHITGSPMTGYAWPLGMNFKTVYLYSPQPEDDPVDPETFFDLLVQEARGLALTAQDERKRFNAESSIDIEVRIPRSTFPLFWAFTCPSAIDKLVDKAKEEIMAVYDQIGDEKGKKNDKWEINIVEGTPECPVRLCQHGVDEDEMWERELDMGGEWGRGELGEMLEGSGLV